MRTLAALAALLLATSSAAATGMTKYYTFKKNVPLQTGQVIAHSSNGYFAAYTVGSCKGDHPASWFASAPAGSTVLVCGTLTAPLTFSAAGVTLWFEQAATVTVPVCPPGGCITTNGFARETILGGAIRATGNGTGLANEQPDSVGLYLDHCAACTVTGLTVTGIYTRTSATDYAPSTQDDGIYVYDGTVTLTDVTVANAAWAIYERDDTPGASATVTGSTLTGADHGVALTFNTAGTYGPFVYTNDTFSGFAAWDSPDDAYHHDGIHCYTSGTGGTPAHLSGLTITGDTFEMDGAGANTTAGVFLEGGTGPGSTPCADPASPITISRDAFTSAQAISNGLIGAFSGSPTITYNTLDSAGTAISANGGTNGVVQHNQIESTGTLVDLSPSMFPPGTVDYNTYSGGNDNAFVCEANPRLFLPPTAFTQWQTCIGGDTHSSTQ